MLNPLGGGTRWHSPCRPRRGPTETTTLSFDVSGIPASSIPPELVGGQGGSIPPGTYLARVRVDGAESRLVVDASGKFIDPIVRVP